MKKWLAFLLALCFAAVFVSCADTGSSPAGDISTSGGEAILPDGAHRFTGRVQQVSERSIDVYTEDASMTRISTYFTVQMPLGEDGKFFFVGDTVEVVFTGAIAETFPAQIMSAVSVTLLKSVVKPEADSVSVNALVTSVDESEKTIFVSALDEELCVNVSVIGFSNMDFAVGDVLKIVYAASKEDLSVGEIKNPTEIRYCVRTRTDATFTAEILESAEDHIRIMGEDEAYAREFKLMTARGANFSAGERIRVSFTFRGQTPDQAPYVIKDAFFHSLTPKASELHTVWARLTDVYATTGWAEASFYMLYTFIEEWELYAGQEDSTGAEYFHTESRTLHFPDTVSLREFREGDYVEISFFIPEGLPETDARCEGISIRRLTDGEIDGIYRETVIAGIYLGENDREMAFDIGDGVYYVQKDEWNAKGKKPPALTYGDAVQIVTDGMFFVELRLE